MIAETEEGKKSQAEARRPGVAGPACIMQHVRLFFEINAHVKPVMVPVCFVFATPIPIVVHAGNIFANLRTIFAVLCSITIDPCAIRFEPIVAIRSRIAERRVAG
jgi:hypothetical protein